MFKITYFDNKEFEGKSLPNSDWKYIEDKPIKFFDYRVGNILYTLVNFNEYNHLIERVAFKNTKISKIMIVGRSDKESCIITFADKVYFNVTEVGHEYGNYKQTDEIIGYHEDKSPKYKSEFIPQLITGWKKGEKLSDPYIIMKDLKNGIIKTIYSSVS